MPIFELERAGKTFEVEAPDQEAAVKSFSSYNKQPAKPQPENKPGVLERLKTGFMDPIYGAAQIGARMQGTDIGEAAWADPKAHEELVKSVDETVKNREAEYQKRRGDDGIDWARLAGSIANPLNYVGALTGGVPGAVVSGAMSGALQPANDYAKEKAYQALFGAAFGGVGGAATTAAGKAISPVVSKAAAALMAKGVELTPGQLAGGILRRAEEAAKSFPILGSFIRGAEGRSIESFNISVLNQVLEPIKEKLPSSVKAGHEAIAYTQARLSDAYDRLLPGMHFTIDRQFASDLSNLNMLVQEMPPPQAKQFDNILYNRVAQRLQPTGTMNGQTLKQVESELSNFASEMRSSSDAAHRQLGTTINEVRTIIRDTLARQNPNQAAELQRINSAYAMFVRAQSAAAQRAGSAGTFTPMDLLRAIKSQDKSVRKGEFARGDALMQEFAEYGQFLLPSKMPDSGTPERVMWDMLGLSTAFLKPQIPIGLGVASIPYTKAGTAAVRGIAQPGPVRKAIRGGLETATPFTGPGAALTGAITDVAKPFYEQ